MVKMKALNLLIIVIGLLLQMLPFQVNAQVSYPEDGWWWDADASGRGYFIERQKDYINFNDSQHGVLDWFGESIPINRFFGSWADAADQLTGTWLLTELENSSAFSQLVTIERNDLTGSALISNAVSGAEVGSVELLDSDLFLTLTGASESELPLLIPESKRFYAGYGDSNALQVIGVRLDDLPLGATDTTEMAGTTYGVLCNYFGTDDNNAHVQPGGEYHYHGMPEGFVTKRGGNSSAMTLIGWAADGFPIYARYGYGNPPNSY